MSMFKYMFGKLKEINTERLSILIDKISKESGKSKSYVLCDMVYNFLKYGISYTDYIKGNYVNLDKEQKKYYLTAKNYYRFIRYFNNENYWMLFHDKIIFNEIFHDFLKREFVDLRKISYDDFLRFLKNKKTVYAKKHNSFGGNGVSKIKLDDSTDYKKLYDSLLENKQFLIEEEIIQHPLINNVNPTVVNNIRVVTLLKDQNVDIIASVFRTNNGQDNVINCDDICVLLNEEGNAVGVGVDDYCNLYTHHPKTNFKFSELKIPYMNEIIEMTKKAALRVPEMRFVGWDIAISINGPVMIEGNNCPEYGLHQNYYLDKSNVGLLKRISTFIGNEFEHIKL